MYCKNCGTHNDESALYCHNDGAPLKEVTNLTRVVKEKNLKFCKNCSHPNLESALYCESCGSSLEKKEVHNKHQENVLRGGRKTSDTARAETAAAVSLEGFLTKENLISSAKVAGVNFLVLVIISFFINRIINSNASEFVADILRSEGIPGGLANSINFITTTEVMMLTHLVGLSYNVDAAFFTFRITSSGGLLLFLLIPALIIFISGYRLRNSLNGSFKELLIKSVSISAIYGMALVLLGLIGGVSVSMSDPSGLFDNAFTLSASYGVFNSFFNAFVISMIFLVAGGLVSIASKHASTNFDYRMSVKLALRTTAVGLATMILFISLLVGLKEDYQREEVPTTISALMFTQFGSYFWNMSHLNSFGFELTYEREYVDAKYSLLGGVSSTFDEVEVQEAFREIFGNPWYLLFVPILLHVWAGMQLKRVASSNIIRELAVYAVVFGLINAIITHFANFSFNGIDMMMMTLGFNVLSVFFFSTLIAFAVTYGYVLFTGQPDVSDYEEPARHSA